MLKHLSSIEQCDTQDATTTDNRGWTVVHHAAFHGYHGILQVHTTSHPSPLVATQHPDIP